MSKIYIYKSLISVVLFTILGVFSAHAQITLIDTLTDQDLAQRLAGQGISIFNVTSTCPTGAKGYFEDGASTNLGLDKGIVLTSGDIQNVVGPNTMPGAGLSHNAPGDPDLDNLITSNSNDACVLEFDIEVSSDSMTFRYVFGSEEYPEFVASSFNDVFGFFISGPGITGTENIALIPGTTTPVSINNVNNGNYNCPTNPPPGPCVNCNYYVDNCGGPTIEYDGFTTVLTASKGGLNPCAVYHFKLAVADVSDWILDSGVFLEAGSFRSHNIQIETSTTVGSGFSSAVEECAVQGIFNFKLREIPTDTVVINYVIGGTAINGVDYTSISDSVIFPPGDTAQQIVIQPIIDGVTEGVESVILYLLNDCNNLPYDSAVLTIQDNIQINAAANVDTICELTETQLNASGGFIYSWSPSATLSDPGIKNPVASPTSTTTYSVVGIVGSCIDTAEVEVFVSDEFLILEAGVPDTICLYASSQIDAAVAGNYGPFNYTWSNPNSLDNNQIQDPLAQPDVSTLYSVTVTSSTGCLRTDSVSVIVEGVAPQVELFADPANICGGDTILATADIVSVRCGPTTAPCGAFGVSMIGSDTISSSFPTPFQGFWESSRTQMLYKASELNQSGMDYVKISDIAFNITLKNSSIPYTDLNIKIGCTDSNQLTTFIDSLTLVYSNPMYSTFTGVNTFTLNTPYAWDGVSNLVVEICYTNSNFTNDDFIESSNTSYNSVVQDFSIFDPGCSLNFFPAIAATRPNITIVYCDLAYPNLTYQWNSKNGTITESVDSALIFVDSDEEIELTVWDANCPNTVSVDITVDSAFTVDAGMDTMICQDQLVPLNALINGSSSNLIYSWFPAVSVSDPGDAFTTSVPLNQSTDFIIQAMSISGCEDKDTLTAIVDSSFRVLAGPDQLVCESDQVQLNAMIADRSNFDFSYLWSPSVGLSSTILPNPVADPTFPGQTYILEATSPIGCTKRDTISIDIDSLFTVNPGLDKFICNVRPVQLSASISGRVDSNMTYQWSPASELDDPTIPNPVATPTPLSSTYTLTVTSPVGCEFTNDITITLSDLNTVELFPDTLIQFGDSVQLGALISGGSGNFSYNWSPSLGLSDIATLLTYARPDSDQVYTLIVFDNGIGMCNDTVDIQVRIEYEIPVDSLFAVPTAFTPNGDNSNNTFYPLLRSNDLQVTEFRIYNRWGSIVHEDADTPWNGTWNDVNQPIGSYVYLFELTFPDNRSKIYHGQVTLLR